MNPRIIKGKTDEEINRKIHHYGCGSPLAILIAEIGNNHMGDVDLALELLEAAKDSGADLVKFQAGTGKGFARNKYNKAEVNFYNQFDLGLSGYNKLIKRGKELKIPVFFSIWDKKYNKYWKLKYKKIPARQIFDLKKITEQDSMNTFISIPDDVILSKQDLIFLKDKKSYFLHTIPEYPTLRSPNLKRIEYLQEMLKPLFKTKKDYICGVTPRVGYSDHTIGIKSCVKAVKKYGAVVIEKHFKLKEQSGGLRDFVHSVSPDKFKEMRDKING